jgi:NAD(P)-dependent dehydrogenase (short-subunit alcohol dehydrogenase family)
MENPQGSRTHNDRAGRGGSIILVSSVAGLKALPAQAHYVSAKHALVGLTKAAAIELGPYQIRVNSIHPWGVDTPMGHDDTLIDLVARFPTYAASLGAILAEPNFGFSRHNFGCSTLAGR